MEIQTERGASKHRNQTDQEGQAAESRLATYVTYRNKAGVGLMPQRYQYKHC
jgi:hypothetical protein